MAGAVFAPELKPKSAVTFSIATERDDAEIRALLRNNPMRGRITISLEREPSYFNSIFPTVTIVAREDEKLVCVGSCSIQHRFVNGSPRRVGYLGGLRLDQSRAGRFDILRRGYGLFRELQAESHADFYFTSIAADNQSARAFLERGIKGMPKYEFAGEFVTLVVPTGLQPASIDSTPAADEFVSMINRFGALKQFAPCWSRGECDVVGIRDVILNEHGCGALWDQRAYKQIIIRDYAPSLRWTRPVINLLSSLTRHPPLPPIGQQLPLAYGAFVHGDDKPSVLKHLLHVAGRSGISLLATGFDANDSDLQTIRTQFKGWEYRSRIYLVRWPGIGGGVTDLDRRLLGPEVALL